MLEIYKHLPLFFQMPSYPFFMMIMDGDYGQHVLRTLYGFSLTHHNHLLFPSGGELLFHVESSKGVKPEGLAPVNLSSSPSYITHCLCNC